MSLTLTGFMAYTYLLVLCLAFLALAGVILYWMLVYYDKLWTRVVAHYRFHDTLIAFARNRYEAKRKDKVTRKKTV